MAKIVIEPRVATIKFILAIYPMKAKDIAQKMHVSTALVSKYLNGERNGLDIELFIIEQLFGITIKDYIINE